MCSKGNPVTGPRITEKAKSVCDEMKTTDKCTFCEGWLIILSLSNSVGARLKDSAIIYRNEGQVTAEVLLFGLYSL